MYRTKPFMMNIFSGLGGSGGNYSGQYAVDVQNPTTNAQAQQSYADQQAALAKQAGLVGQLQGQNGIQNQSNVFAQQQALANQLQGQTQGQGANPAQAALAQNTAANTANQASLMAGQRGTGANAGMLARQAAMQGAANQQASVGQAATLQAQQQLAAQQQLQAQQQAMAGLSSTQTGQLQNAIGGQNQYALQGQSNILNAIQGQNNAAVGMQTNINNVNSGIQSGNQANQSGMLMGGLGGIATAFGYAQGGEVQHFDAGGTVQATPMQLNAAPIQNGPQSMLGQQLQEAKTAGGVNTPLYNIGDSGTPQMGKGAANKDIMNNMSGLVGKGAKAFSGSSTTAPEVEGGTESITGGAGGSGTVTSEPLEIGGGSLGGGGGGAAGAGGASLGAGAGLFAAPFAFSESGGRNKEGVGSIGKSMGDMFHGEGLFGSMLGGGKLGKAHGGDVKRPGSGAPPREASGEGPYGNTTQYQQAVQQPKQKEQDNTVLGEGFNEAHGGSVDVMVSPGEKMYYPGGRVEKVKGEAKVDGDSLKNDTVPKKVPPHTIVVPRTKADGGGKEAQFVAAILARKGMKR